MKFTIEKAVFSKSLSKLLVAIDPHPVIAYLAGIKITIEKGIATLQASDGDLSVIEKIEVGKSEDGEILVFGRKFYDIITKLPSGEISFTQKDNTLFIKQGKTNFNLALMDTDLYQPLPQFPNIIGSAKGEDLNSSITANSVSVSKGEVNADLSGILLELGASTITLLSTDRYRLTKRTIPYSSNFKDITKKTLVKSSVLTSILKTFEEDEIVNIGVDNIEKDGDIKLFGFSTPTTTVTTQVLNASKYPDLSQLFVDEFSTKIVVNKEELSKSLDLSLVVSTDNKVKFSASNNALLITSGNETEASIDETIEANISSKEELVELSLNPNYVLDGIKNFESPFISINLNLANQPVQFEGLESIDAKVSTQDKYIVVPIRS